MGHGQKEEMTVTEVKGVTETRDKAMTGTSQMSGKQGRSDGSHDCETDLVWRVLAEAWLG